MPRRIPACLAKQLIHFHAEALGQLEERAGMWIRGAAGQAAKRAFVEFRGLYDIFKRQPAAGHKPAQVQGHGGGLVVGRLGNQRVTR